MTDWLILTLAIIGIWSLGMFTGRKLSEWVNRRYERKQMNKVRA